MIKAGQPLIAERFIEGMNANTMIEILNASPITSPLTIIDPNDRLSPCFRNADILKAIANRRAKAGVTTGKASASSGPIDRIVTL